MGCSCINTEIKESKKSKKIINKYSNTDIRKQFEFVYMLGNGAFGKVRLYRDKNDHQILYAIKTLKKKNIPKYEFNLLKSEVEILSELDHPNIVNYFGTFEDNFYIHIVMEYLKGYDLFKVISIKNYTKFDENDMSIIIVQLTKALYFIHSKNIIHRDIKPENIIFANKNDYSSLKLIDFGLATNKKEDNKKVGTPYYMSPEMIKGNFCDKSDIWAIGIILYLMLTDKFPFVQNKDNVFKDICECKYNQKLLDEIDCSEEAKDLVKKILVVDVNKRISSQEILEHPFIKKINKKKNNKLINNDTLVTLKSFANKNALQKEIFYFLAKIKNEEEINNLKQLFNDLDTANSGTLTIDEIRNGFKKLGIEINENELKEIWEGLNFHTDDQINYTEFLAAMMSSYKFNKEENLWIVFNYFKDNDNKKSEYISVDNLINMCKSMNLPINEEEIKKNLEGYNKNKLNFEDFKKIMGIINEDE